MRIKRWCEARGWYEQEDTIEHKIYCFGGDGNGDDGDTGGSTHPGRPGGESGERGGRDDNGNDNDDGEPAFVGERDFGDDDDFFEGTFDDPGEPGFSGPSYDGQNDGEYGNDYDSDNDGITDDKDDTPFGGSGVDNDPSDDAYNEAVENGWINPGDPVSSVPTEFSVPATITVSPNGVVTTTYGDPVPVGTGPAEGTSVGDDGTVIEIVYSNPTSRPETAESGIDYGDIAEKVLSNIVDFVIPKASANAGTRDINQLRSFYTAMLADKITPKQYLDLGKELGFTLQELDPAKMSTNYFDPELGMHVIDIQVAPEDVEFSDDYSPGSFNDSIDDDSPYDGDQDLGELRDELSQQAMETTASNMYEQLTGNRAETSLSAEQMSSLVNTLKRVLDNGGTIGEAESALRTEIEGKIASAYANAAAGGEDVNYEDVADGVFRPGAGEGTAVEIGSPQDVKLTIENAIAKSLANSGLTSAEVNSIVNGVLNGLPENPSAQDIADAVNAGLGEVSTLTKMDVTDIILESISDLSTLTAEDVTSILKDQLADLPTPLTNEEVSDIISSAIDGLPDYATPEDVTEIVSTAIEAADYASPEDVELAIDTAIDDYATKEEQRRAEEAAAALAEEKAQIGVDVKNEYTEILGRDPTEEELTGYIDGIVNDTINIDNVTNDLLKEAQGIQQEELAEGEAELAAGYTEGGVGDYYFGDATNYNVEVDPVTGEEIPTIQIDIAGGTTLPVAIKDLEKYNLKLIGDPESDTAKVVRDDYKPRVLDVSAGEEPETTTPAVEGISEEEMAEIDAQVEQLKTLEETTDFGELASLSGAQVEIDPETSEVKAPVTDRQTILEVIRTVGEGVNIDALPGSISIDENGRIMADAKGAGFLRAVTGKDPFTGEAIDLTRYERTYDPDTGNFTIKGPDVDVTYDPRELTDTGTLYGQPRPDFVTITLDDFQQMFGPTPDSVRVTARARFESDPEIDREPTEEEIEKIVERANELIREGRDVRDVVGEATREAAVAAGGTGGEPDEAEGAAEDVTAGGTASGGGGRGGGMSFTPEGTVTSPTQQGDADVTSPAGGAGQPMPEVDLPVADVDPDKLARIAATRGYLSQGDISKAQTAGVPESQLRDLFNRYLYLIQGDQGEEVGSEDKFGLGPKFSEGTLGLGGGPIVPVPAAGEGLIGDDGGLIGPEGGEDIFDFTGGGEGEGEGTGPGGGEGTGEGEAGTGGEGEGAGGVGTGEGTGEGGGEGTGTGPVTGPGDGTGGGDSDEPDDDDDFPTVLGEGPYGGRILNFPIGDPYIPFDDFEYREPAITSPYDFYRDFGRFIVSEPLAQQLAVPSRDPVTGALVPSIYAPAYLGVGDTVGGGNTMTPSGIAALSTLFGVQSE